MISRYIEKNMASGSMIRQMFEEGARLKEQYGAQHVFDFSLGNPDLEPPQAVHQALQDLVNQPTAGQHAYMSNQGLASTRGAVARLHAGLSGLPVQADDVCMTVGAAGALNVMLKAILNPGDEVLVLAPFFFEYRSYIENHGGRMVVVASDPESLLPDLAAIGAALTEKTKALILNTPNNPSGVVVPAQILQALNQLLLAHSQPVLVLSDEPYADLVYDGQVMPSTLAHLDNAVICTSWSKSLSLPGERIGCLVISPRCQDRAQLARAASYCNRILGYVNAPALFQRVIERALHARVAVEAYEKRRNLLWEVLTEAGFTVNKPAGGLYLFPQCPGPDDVAFAHACAAHRVLLVPGSAFWFPGHLRLCFAVHEETILGAAPQFEAIARQAGLR